MSGVREFTTFIAPSGRKFTCLSDYPVVQGDILFSEPGGRLQQIIMRSAASKDGGPGDRVVNMTFGLSRRGVDHKLRYDEETILYDGETYVKE